MESVLIGPCPGHNGCCPGQTGSGPTGPAQNIIAPGPTGQAFIGFGPIGLDPANGAGYGP